MLLQPESPKQRAAKLGMLKDTRPQRGHISDWQPWHVSGLHLAPTHTARMQRGTKNLWTKLLRDGGKTRAGRLILPPGFPQG